MASAVVEHGALGHVGFAVMAPRLWSTGSVVVGHRLSCSRHMGSSQIMYQTLCLLALADRFFLSLNHQEALTVCRNVKIFVYSFEPCNITQFLSSNCFLLDSLAFSFFFLPTCKG